MNINIDLSYELSSRWNKARRTRCEEASESELLFEMFLGDLIFRVGDADFSARWGWVPILDMVRQLLIVVRRLGEGVLISVDFTESDALLKFQPQDGSVTVSSTYSPGTARVSIDDFREAAEGFSVRALRDFEMRCPGLMKNPRMVEMAPADG